MFKGVLEKALRIMEANEQFTMEEAFHGDLDAETASDLADCGTPGCIAGHILAAASPLIENANLAQSWSEEEMEDEDLFTLAASAADIFDLDCQRLFMPKYERDCYDFNAGPTLRGYITKEHAMACLRNFIDTGEVDWLGTAPKGDSNE